MTEANVSWPLIRTVGLSGMLVTFAPQMSEPANRAALAFRADVAAQDWPDVIEVSTRCPTVCWTC